MANVKDKYWTEMYNTITNYNDRNHTPLSNVKIAEAIDKIILEEQAEANNNTVDTFITTRNESNNLFNKIESFTIDDVGKNLINKFAKMKINDVRDDLIGCVVNMTINYVKNDLYIVNASDVQV